MFFVVELTSFITLVSISLSRESKLSQKEFDELFITITQR
jgi:hypothetical protein